MDCDVAIVGAGLAGLAAADEIMRLAPMTKVVILEARERVGGRTETVPSHAVDIGAQWIGPTHSEMLSLAQRFDLKLAEQFYPAAQSTRLTECVGYDQVPLTPTQAENVRKYMNLVEEYSAALDVERPWTHRKAKEWDSISVKDHVEQAIPSDRVAQKEVLLFVQTVLACCPPQTSFLFFLFYVKSGGGMEALGDGDNGAQKYKVDGGMQQICTRLAKSLVGSGNVDIKMGFAVTECDVMSDSVRLRSLATGTASSSAIITCKRVVFAIPPQLLVGKIRFTPELPLEKQQLGQNLLAGHAVKVITAYDKAFWLENQNADDETGPNKPHFTELGPMHNLFHAHDIPALVGLITGEAALEFEKLPVEERRRRVVQQLSAMYMPRHKGSKATLDPHFYVDKVWAKEEHSGGCFAGICPPNGSLVAYGEQLRKELDRVHFCSTETSPEFYGYMEGAVRSGRRAAREVVKHLCSTLIS